MRRPALSWNVVLGAAALLFAAGCPAGNMGPIPDGSPVTWENIAGDNGDERGRSIIELADGGSLAAGFTNSQGSQLFSGYLVRYKRAGAIVWAVAYPVGGYLDDFYDAVELSDGTFVAVGLSGSSPFTPSSASIVWVDAAGVLLDSLLLEGPGADSFSSIAQLSDGTLVAAGTSRSIGFGNGDVYVVRFTADGQILWERNVGGTGADAASDVVEDPDGNIVVVGRSESFVNQPAAYALKLDTAGNLIWQRVRSAGFMSTAPLRYEGAAALSGGRVAALGSIADTGLLVLYDRNGQTISSRTNFTGSNDEFVAAVAATRDGGLALALTASNMNGTEDDIVIARLDADTNLLWTRSYDPGQFDLAEDIVDSFDGGFLVTGAADLASEEVYTLKVNSEGAVVP